jgi:hypothetical protein
MIDQHVPGHWITLAIGGLAGAMMFSWAASCVVAGLMGDPFPLFGSSRVTDIPLIGAAGLACLPGAVVGLAVAEASRQAVVKGCAIPFRWVHATAFCSPSANMHHEHGRADPAP